MYLIILLDSIIYPRNFNQIFEPSNFHGQIADNSFILMSKMTSWLHRFFLSLNCVNSVLFVLKLH